MRPVRLLPALLAVALILPASAAAATSSGESSEAESAKSAAPKESEPRFELDGGNGYAVIVSADSSSVRIGIDRPNAAETGIASATYVARRRGGGDSIVADFGRFGRVALRFRPSPAAPLDGPPAGCLGPADAHTSAGTFVGRFDFRGQGGYIQLHAHRIKGEVVTPASELCPETAGSIGVALAQVFASVLPSQVRARLGAFIKEGIGGTFFEAQRGKVITYQAAIERTVGSVAIYDYAATLGERDTFSSNRQVSFARVAPPAPFEGSATLRRAPGGTRTWSGDLSATFPGASKVPLAGPEFRTYLSRSFP